MTKEQLVPSWSWVCDSCGARHGLAYSQAELPKPETMRRRGWQISKGAPVQDLCPTCVALVKSGTDKGLKFQVRLAEF